MRSHSQNSVDNVLSKMFNTNRDYISQEISRTGSIPARETTYRRNGILNFGAQQMMGLVSDSNFMVIGSISGSPIVGP